MLQSASQHMSSVLSLCLILFSATAVVSQPLLVVTVPDTILAVNQLDHKIPIYLDNFDDSIGALQLTFSSSRPDLVKFAGFDTTGTLVSGFSHVVSLNVGGDSSIIQVYCQATSTGGSSPTGGVAPQQGGVLIFLKLEVASEIDTTGDNSADIQIILPGGFSTPNGQSIGAIPVTVYDTTYYLCTDWNGEYCLDYVEVNPDSSEFDFISVESRIVPWLDSNLVWLTDGSVTLIETLCGVCDLDCTGELDIGDLTALVRYIFIESPTGDPVSCDWDNDSYVDISDVTALIRYLFIGGDPPL